MFCLTGTQQAHKIKINGKKIELYETAEDEVPVAVRKMEEDPCQPILDQYSVGEWIACVYDGDWHIAQIEELDLDEEEVKVNWWRNNTKGSTTAFFNENAFCCVPVASVLKKVCPKKARGRRTNRIEVPLQDQKDIEQIFRNFMA